MADFLTDSDDERAVEDVLSQAMDLSVLEQIAAINCSSFSTSDHLPSDLENRFRRLKSLPTASTTAVTAGPSSSFNKRHNSDRFADLKKHSEVPGENSDGNRYEKKVTNSRSKLKSKSASEFRKTMSLKSRSESSLSTDEQSDENRDEKKRTNSRSNSRSKPKSSSDFRKTKSLKSRSGTGSPESSLSTDEHSDGNREEKTHTNSSSKPKSKPSSELRKTKSLKSRSGTGLSESSLSSDEHSDGNRCEKKHTNSRSISKPKPKSSSEFRKTKSLKSRPVTVSSDSWSLSSPESEPSPPRRGIGCLWCSPKRKQGKENRDVEFLKSFSSKEQKILRKAMKEEEKINKEAEKIVKWAKQASSRMIDVSDLEDELTDHERR